MTTVPFRSKTSVAGLVAAMRSDPHAPISAMIEIADRCNEVCVHCYQVQGQKGEMTTEQIKSVLDQLADLGVLFLTISGGEATLRPDFLEIVAHARAKKFAVKLYTNGLTMTEELARALADLAVQEVQISLYSHRSEVHDWVTRVPGSWEKTVQGVRNLRAVGVAVAVKTPLMRVNQDDYPAWIALAQSLDADYMIDPHLDPREDGDRTPAALRIDDETYLRVMADPTVSPPVREEPPARDLGRSLCGACSGNVHVEANGEMRPCTQMTVPVGNALVDGVAAAWETNETAETLRHLTWNDLHGCRDCDLQPYCSRCFANAQGEDGDALGPYRSACHRAQLHYRLTRKVIPEVRAGSGVDRDPAVGPYREVALGVLETIADVHSASDEHLAAQHGWIRPARVATVEMPSAITRGELVQIRRPGKRPRWERVPGPSPEPGE